MILNHIYWDLKDFSLEFGAETLQIWSTHELNISWSFEIETPSESLRTGPNLYKPDLKIDLVLYNEFWTESGETSINCIFVDTQRIPIIFGVLER